MHRIESWGHTVDSVEADSYDTMVLVKANDNVTYSIKIYRLPCTQIEKLSTNRCQQLFQVVECNIQDTETFCRSISSWKF